MGSHKMKKHNFWIAAVSLLVVMSVSIYVYAQYGQRGTQQQPQQQQQHTQLKLQSTDKLMDVDVISLKGGQQTGQPGQHGDRTPQQQAGQRGEKLGEVEEIVFDNDNDSVYCVVVSANNTYYPVPWQAFDQQCLMSKYQQTGQQGQTGMRGQEGTQQQGRPAGETDQGRSRWGWQRQRGDQGSPLCLNMSPEQFRQAPSVDSVDIAQLSDPSLKQRVCDFYMQHGMMQGDRGRQAMGGQQGQQQRQQMPRGQQQAQANLFKASEIIDYDVRNYEGEDMAEIEDLIIDVQHGNLAYALVSFGGILGIGQETAAVPWSALTLEQEEEYAMLDATEETLNASVIEEGNLDRLSQQQFARDIHQRYEAEPYWEVFGFVPATGEQSIRAWKHDSEYNRKYNKDKTTTIEGTIRNVGAFSPEEGATQGVRLRVMTEDDKSMIVYAGPRHWTMQRDVDLTTGKDVKVKGSRTEVNGKQVIIASEITVDGKTLRLRDEEGKPQWSDEDLQRGMQQQGGQQQR